MGILKAVCFTVKMRQAGYECALVAAILNPASGTLRVPPLTHLQVWRACVEVQVWHSTSQHHLKRQLQRVERVERVTV
jgi:hypothetical protein